MADNFFAVMDKLQVGLDHLHEFSQASSRFISDKYVLLKQEDRKVNLVCTLLFTALIFYHAPMLSIPLIITGAVIGSSRESVQKLAKKTAGIWETHTVRTAAAFACCMLIYRNFWHATALGYGIFLAYGETKQPEVVSPPLPPQVDAAAPAADAHQAAVQAKADELDGIL